MNFHIERRLEPTEKQDINFLLSLYTHLITLLADVQNLMDNFDISANDELWEQVREEFHELLEGGAGLIAGQYRTAKDYRRNDGPMYREDFNNYVDAIQREPVRLHMYEPFQELIDEHTTIEERLDEVYEAIEETPFGMVSNYLPKEKRWIGGTLVRDTVQNEDIIGPMLSALKNTPEYAQLMMASTCANWLDPYCDTSNIDKEDADLFVTELYDVLASYAPEGFTFGAHYGDGADIGYWPVECPDDSQ